MSEHEDYDKIRDRGPLASDEALAALREKLTGSAEVRTTSSTGGQKGVKIERFDLIPIGPLTHLARHYGAGARKYDDHQWRKGYEWSKGIAALLRHFTKFMAGEDYDICANEPNACKFTDADGNQIDWAVPGKICFNHTGNHHLDGVMWHAFSLREFVDKFPEHDDRFKG